VGLGAPARGIGAPPRAATARERILAGSGSPARPRVDRSSPRGACAPLLGQLAHFSSRLGVARPPGSHFDRLWNEQDRNRLLGL